MPFTLVDIAVLMWPSADAVQSARGSATPPAESENNSTSTGMMTILAAGGSCVKPGARYFDEAGTDAFGAGGVCENAGPAPIMSVNASEARADAWARACRANTLRCV